jgi:uracil-DNA glycosylase
MTRDDAGRRFEALRTRAATCRRCPLWRHATQTVFGEGALRPRLMLVGEQPGDVEDRDGHPFVGPAGRLLREVLGEIGIDPADVYLTNSVKHFKFETRGKRRIHEKPNRRPRRDGRERAIRAGREGDARPRQTRHVDAGAHGIGHGPSRLDPARAGP